MVKNNTLGNIVRGKSVEYIVRALSSLYMKLLRFERSGMYLCTYAPNNLQDAEKRLMALRTKILRLGMSAVLTDGEVSLLDVAMNDGRSSKAYRLSEIVHTKDDVRNILSVIPNQIDALYKRAELNDREWWETGADMSKEANYDRLRALQLLSLYGTISQDGMDAMLSPSQAQSIFHALLYAMNAYRLSSRLRLNRMRKPEDWDARFSIDVWDIL